MQTPTKSLAPRTTEELKLLVAQLRESAAQANTDADLRMVTSRIASLTRTFRIQHGIGIPTDPSKQAMELDESYVVRPHTAYLSHRLSEAVRDVERGHNRMMAVSMPPRAGKSTLLSRYAPLWLLRRHPEWKIVMTSHDGALISGWARGIRQLIEAKPQLGIALAPDGGAGSHWATLEGGGMFATSVRGALTGRGARVLVIDDPVKDFVEAHSLPARQRLWDWWLSVAQTRLEPPYLVIVVMTRWHEDDFVGRLLNPELEGDPRDWEQINLPAIADRPDDPIGRAEGEPLFTPLLDETREQAVERWMGVRRAVGTYTFSAMYQQRPAPAKGAIFDAGWWRYWTTNEQRATGDGRVVYLNPASLTGGQWIDSWDCNFDATDESKGSYVVGQRWVRAGANRYLVAQQRGRWSFTQTIARMQRWQVTDDPYLSLCGHLVHERLIEKKANGAAIIDTLKDTIPGLIPVNPTASKEARARAITPEVESGNVYLPHPGDPGNEWVAELLSELRNFPHDVADDQVDALTQALTRLRTEARASITVPGRSLTGRELLTGRSITRAALTDRRRGFSSA